jgi:hypothetical protein
VAVSLAPVAGECGGTFDLAGAAQVLAVLAIILGGHGPTFGAAIVCVSWF